MTEGFRDQRSGSRVLGLVGSGMYYVAGTV